MVYALYGLTAGKRKQEKMSKVKGKNNIYKEEQGNGEKEKA